MKKRFNMRRELSARLGRDCEIWWSQRAVDMEHANRFTSSQLSLPVRKYSVRAKRPVKPTARLSTTNSDTLFAEQSAFKHNLVGPQSRASQGYAGKHQVAGYGKLIN